MLLLQETDGLMSRPRLLKMFIFCDPAISLIKIFLRIESQICQIVV